MTAPVQPRPAAAAHSTDPDAAPPVARPLLKPALRRLWRGPATLQLGLAPRHAVVLTGVGPAQLRVLDLLDGTRTFDEVTAQARAVDGDAADVRRLLAALTAAGALDDSAVAGPAVDEGRRQRLEPDRLALSLRRRRPGAAAEALRRRSTSAVTVHGADRVGATLVSLLAAAGVGRLGCVDDAPVGGADLAPGGIRARVSGPRAAAVVADLAAVTPATRARTVAVPDADLTVVASVGSPLPELLHAVRHTPHLLVTVQETTAAVGPLVVPGRTPCLRCLQLYRTERDPAWPALAAQLAGSRRQVEPCDVVLATLAATVAAGEVLAWLDGEPTSSTGGVLELELDGPRVRRRSLVAHPACGCGAAD